MDLQGYIYKLNKYKYKINQLRLQQKVGGGGDVITIQYDSINQFQVISGDNELQQSLIDNIINNFTRSYLIRYNNGTYRYHTGIELYKIRHGQDLTKLDIIFREKNIIIKIRDSESVLPNLYRINNVFFENILNIPTSVYQIYYNSGRFGNFLFCLFKCIHQMIDNNGQEPILLIGISSILSHHRHSDLTYGINPNVFVDLYSRSMDNSFVFPIGSNDFTIEAKYRQEYINLLPLINSLSPPELEETYFDVAMHFRGGDFCNTDQNFTYGYGSPYARDSKFFVLHFKYYLDALYRIKNPKQVVIFHQADDNNIVSIMIKYLKQYFPNVSFYRERDMLGDMEMNEFRLIYIMSQFKHIVMSNSSLSFWSGFLSERAVNVIGLLNEDDKRLDYLVPYPYTNTWKNSSNYNTKTQQWIDNTPPIYKKKEYLFPCFLKWKGKLLDHICIFYLIHLLYNNLPLNIDNYKSIFGYKKTKNFQYEYICNFEILNEIYTSIKNRQRFDSTTLYNLMYQLYYQKEKDTILVNLINKLTF